MTGSLRPALLRPLALLCAAAVLLAALPKPGAQAASSLPSSASEAIAADVFTRLNDERAARGLPALRWDAQLAGLATGWSAHMSRTRSYVHNDLAAVFRDPAFASRWDGLGENIHQILPGQATAGRAHVDWMRSAGHRMNMLNAGYDAVGIGIVCDGDGRMWATQNFGRDKGSHRPGYDRTAPPADPVRRGDAGGSSCDAHLHARHGADWPADASIATSDVRHESVTLRWSAATRNVLGYRLEMDSGQGYEVIATFGPDGRSHTQARLGADTVHRFRVQVRDARDRYHAGPEVTVRTQERPAATAALPNVLVLLDAAAESVSRFLALASSMLPSWGTDVLAGSTNTDTPASPAPGPGLLGALHPAQVPAGAAQVPAGAAQVPAEAAQVPAGAAPPPASPIPADPVGTTAGGPPATADPAALPQPTTSGPEAHPPVGLDLAGGGDAPVGTDPGTMKVDADLDLGLGLEVDGLLEVSVELDAGLGLGTR